MALFSYHFHRLAWRGAIFFKDSFQEPFPRFVARISQYKLENLTYFRGCPAGAVPSVNTLALLPAAPCTVKIF